MHQMLTIVFTILLGTDVVFALNVWGWYSKTSPWRPSLLRFLPFFPSHCYVSLYGICIFDSLLRPPFPQLRLHFVEFGDVLRLNRKVPLYMEPTRKYTFTRLSMCHLCTRTVLDDSVYKFFLVCFVPGSLRLDESVFKFFCALYFMLTMKAW